ncbi:(2Fe-2S)-binding protein (plasmid) [Skermanella rosea]|uniref:(2Fe-2S)-binding protein n=1 Tax=Skermanella rosea TaxID=1817965 RepID=UPI0019315B0B|nr:(2Fe-2S)-binding protein [Skermanella rosea]UEM07608.1 (2Fe-2S)-binding protein [Skermanella rosea]
MYVCICNAFTEKQVCTAIRKGISTPSGLFRHLGCVPQCGKCVPTVRYMVKETDNLSSASVHYDEIDHFGLQAAG